MMGGLARSEGCRILMTMRLGFDEFMEGADNIVFIGDLGTDKSGLAIGLVRQALANGHGRRLYGPGTS